MANLLSDATKQQVIAFGQLGCYAAFKRRRVRRETAGAYLKAARLAVRPPGRWGHPPKPAKAVSTDLAHPASDVSTEPGWPPPPRRAPIGSACAPYRELIELALAPGPQRDGDLAGSRR